MLLIRTHHPRGRLCATILPLRHPPCLVMTTQVVTTCMPAPTVAAQHADQAITVQFKGLRYDGCTQVCRPGTGDTPIHAGNDRSRRCEGAVPWTGGVLAQAEQLSSSTNGERLDPARYER